jgi:hypothetical protein
MMENHMKKQGADKNEWFQTINWKRQRAI